MFNGIFDKNNLYELVKEDVWDTNWKYTRPFALLTMLCFAGLTILSLLSDYLSQAMSFYLAFAVLSAVCFVGTFAMEKGPLWMKQALAFMLLAILLGYGIVMGTIIHPEDITVSYIVMLIAVPLVMTVKPSSINTLLVASVVVYLVLAWKYQPADIFEDNLYDVVPYGIVSCFLSSIIMKMKFQRSFYKIEAERLAYYDQLTGCKNRQALNWVYQGNYDKEKPMGLLMMDLNGLKKVNDEQGHEAGDRYIKKAAEDLMAVMGKDNAYRMGGDEFVGLLLGVSEKDFNAKIDQLRARAGASASIGMVYCARVTQGFDDLLSVADKEMYKEKAAFYQQRGMERRKQ